MPLIATEPNHSPFLTYYPPAMAVPLTNMSGTRPVGDPVNVIDGYDTEYVTPVTAYGHPDDGAPLPVAASQFTCCVGSICDD
jgi:hypothetical protein